MEFYKGKRVLITGHTGFKGSWMCRVLLDLGADVTGYALDPPTEPSLFELCALDKQMRSVTGDIRDLEHLNKTMMALQPEVVIHMAAQPIVRTSYREPVYTYETNVMGTVNILEAVRRCPSVRSVINVTTDKVYENKEWPWGYRENDELNGFDPYSNSKSCSELVTSSYRNSFFGGNAEDDRRVAVSTCRAGNVIGGGDVAKDRIVPDCFRAVSEGKEIYVRNPSSVRPYQHVLEPVMAYLLVAMRQYENAGLIGSYNIGPDDTDCRTTAEMVDIFCSKWNAAASEDRHLNKATWSGKPDNGPHEAGLLKLDCSKIKAALGWKPEWDLEKALEKTVEWHAAYLGKEDVSDIMSRQISEYLNSDQESGRL